MNFTINSSLHLRHFSPSDKEELFMLVDQNREHLNTFLAWPAKTKTSEDSLWFINDSLKDGEENCHVWAIVFETKIVGVCSFNELSVVNKKTEIGYWLASEYTGKGIVTLSVKSLINHAFNNLNLNRVAILCSTLNKPSSNIPLKLGFTLEGTLRQNEVVGANTYDHFIYSILQDDFTNLEKLK